MRISERLTAMIVAVFLCSPIGLVTAARAAVDNSQPPTAVFCSGSCGVGSSVGFNRTVPQIAVGDYTSFTDIWDISLSEAGNINGFLFANNTLNSFRLIDLNVGLEDGGVPVDPIGGFTVPNPPPVNSVLQTAVAFSNLAAGNYQFVVSGIVPDGYAAGQYEFQGEVSQVPLPAAVWLFLSALLGLMAWVRGGRTKAATA